MLPWQLTEINNTMFFSNLNKDEIKKDEKFGTFEKLK